MTLTLKVDEQNLYNSLMYKEHKKTSEYNFNYKDYFINLDFLSNGIVSVYVSNDYDNFNHKYIFYTKKEIIKDIKQKIKERITTNKG